MSDQRILIPLATLEELNSLKIQTRTHFEKAEIKDNSLLLTSGNGKVTTIPLPTDTAELTKELQVQVELHEGRLKIVEDSFKDLDTKWLTKLEEVEAQEQVRVLNEEKRDTQEADRVLVEQARKTAEIARADKENTRSREEERRQLKENERSAEELKRDKAEQTRELNEAQRKSNQASMNESIQRWSATIQDWTSAEGTRQSNEQHRKTAFTKIQDDFKQLIGTLGEDTPLNLANEIVKLQTSTAKHFKSIVAEGDKIIMTKEDGTSTEVQLDIPDNSADFDIKLKKTETSLKSYTDNATGKVQTNLQNRYDGDIKSLNTLTQSTSETATKAEQLATQVTGKVDTHINSQVFSYQDKQYYAVLKINPSTSAPYMELIEVV